MKKTSDPGLSRHLVSSVPRYGNLVADMGKYPNHQFCFRLEPKGTSLFDLIPKGTRLLVVSCYVPTVRKNMFFAIFSGPGSRPKVQDFFDLNPNSTGLCFFHPKSPVPSRIKPSQTWNCSNLVKEGFRLPTSEED